MHTSVTVASLNIRGVPLTGSRLTARCQAIAALARVVRSVPVPAVVCGDFNVDRDSALFGEFIAGAALDDAFEGSCPATFRAEYLPAGDHR